MNSKKVINFLEHNLLHSDSNHYSDVKCFHENTYIMIVIACIAIACIVATVLFITGSSRYSSNPTVTPTSSTPMAGIPVYRGSIEYSLASYYYTLLGIPREGHKGVIYKVYFVENATVRDILNWYKNNLAGYEVAADYGISTISTPEGSIEWGAIMFKKDREGLGFGL
ncbi:MAG: hypothetical protein QXU00_03210 [Ignisphaera sp.]